MKKIFIIILVSLSWLLTSLSWAQTESAFLINYADTANFINRINSAHVKALHACSCYILGSKKGRHSSCESYAEPAFIQEGVNIFGEKFAKNFTCEAAIQKFILGPIQRDYQTMVNNMVLMKPEKMLFNRTDAALSESFVTYEFGSPTPSMSSEYKISESPIHEIRSNHLGARIPLKNPLPISAEDKRELLHIYRNFSLKTCATLVTGRLSRSTVLTNKYRAHKPAAICAQIITPSRGINFSMDFPNIFEELKSLRQSTFRKLMMESYVRLISNNPILVMVNSSRPSLNQIVPALSFISKNATERVEESSRHFEQRNYKHFIQYLYADTYARSFWKKGNSKASYERLFIKLSSEFQQREDRKAMIETGLILGVSIGCALPWGRGIGLALQVVKAGCLMGVGVPLNAYFIIDTYLSYGSTLRAFFSTSPGGQSIYQDMQALDDHEFDLKLSAILLPLDMVGSLADTSEGARLLKRALHR